ncbi:aldo/keto reductase, partial [Bacillus sp. B-TM1]
PPEPLPPEPMIGNILAGCASNQAYITVSILETPSSVATFCTVSRTRTAKMLPIIGSGKLDRVKTAALATKVNLDRQQWFTIFESSNGHPVP